MSDDEPVTRRLHVGGLSGQIGGDDLTQLIAKFGLCPVDVHVPTRCLSDPASSWKKGFAIVKVEGKRDGIDKGVRSLNGIMWKGCKLHVAAAKKEHFTDRLEREKAQALVPKPPKYAKKVVAPAVIAPFSGGVLSVRRAKGARRVKVAAEPLLLHMDKQYCRVGGTLKALLEKKDYSVYYPRRVVFSADDLPQIDLEELPRGSLGPPTKSAPGGKSVSPGSATAAPIEPAKPVVKGTGVRKGFGSLVAAPLPKTVERQVEDEVPDGFGVEEDDAHNVDVTDEGLQHERGRALDMLRLVLSAPPKPAMAPPPNAKPREPKSKSKPTATTLAPALAPAAPIPAAPVEQQPGFADVTQLRSIFHRQDGVQWGDEAGALSNSNQVASAGAARDIIFLEAEKLGMEVRALGAAPDATVGADADAGKGMLFNFFGAQPDALADAQPAAAAAALAAAAPIKGASLASLAMLCRAFRRDSSAKAVEERWRDGKEQLVRDYKKKRREMQKKAGGRKKPRLA